MNKQARRKVAIPNITPSKVSPAAELIANNVDLLSEILVRLPAKSTIRFKRVSRHWLSLLSDSQFAITHCNRNPRPSVSGLCFYIEETLHCVSLHGRCRCPNLYGPIETDIDCYCNISPIPLRIPIPRSKTLLRGQPKIRIIQSCNGLLLCSYCERQGYFYDERRQYLVCNPTTKKYTILPKLDGLSTKCYAYLAFDPSKSPHHYKVVLVDSNQIVVYSSQSSCWKKVFLDLEDELVRCGGVFWKGAIHWFTNEIFLERFDVDAEEIIAMPNPRSSKILSLSDIKYFGECGGSLILIQFRLRYPRGFRILELKRDYSGWIVKCRVNLRALISEFPESEFGGFNVLFAMKGESERDYAIVLAFPRRIVSYNVKYKTWDVLRQDPIPLGPRVGASIGFPIVETLFPV